MNITGFSLKIYYKLLDILLTRQHGDKHTVLYKNRPLTLLEINFDRVRMFCVFIELRLSVPDKLKTRKKEVSRSLLKYLEFFLFCSFQNILTAMKSLKFSIRFRRFRENSRDSVIFQKTNDSIAVLLKKRML